MSDLGGFLIAVAIVLAGALVSGALQLQAEAQCIAAGGEVVRREGKAADQCHPLPASSAGVTQRLKEGL